uniref:Anti-phage defense ZorAB system ZorA n=1 Tax=Escherichia coli TaxID=562 RepID=UPI0037870B9D
MSWLNSILVTLTSVEPYKVPVTVIVTVTFAFVCFIFFYLLRSIRIIYGLKKYTRSINSIEKSAPEVQLEHLKSLFQRSELKHAWNEFEESLHSQYELENGEEKIVRIRATAPSASFFSEQQLVDIPLNTEFFKHLPGILTGMGIIGTFYGLMIGLNHFDPSTPEQVSSSVNNLLRDVLYAFLGSAFAIFASILVTWLEKLSIAKSYKYLEKFTAALDSLYDSGVGEEYLASLVKSSNESATQARHLKESLVTDLRDMLLHLAESQKIENERLANTLSATYRESGSQFADQVSGAIENSLKSPLDKIAGAVQTASGDQSGMVQNMLQNVLTAFMAKLDTTFGQQFTNLNEMMGQTVGAIQSAGSSLSLATSELTSVVADYRNNREAVSKSIAMLELLAANTQSEQTTRNQFIADLKQHGERLQSYNREAQVFMENVSDVLGKGFEDFSEGVSRSLDKTLGKLDVEMAKASNLLAGSVEQLGESVSELDDVLSRVRT